MHTGINTLVGASFDPRAAQATQTGLGTTLAGLQSGISAIPAASASAAAANGSAAASASAAGATGFQVCGCQTSVQTPLMYFKPREDA